MRSSIAYQTYIGAALKSRRFPLQIVPGFRSTGPKELCTRIGTAVGRIFATAAIAALPLFRSFGPVTIPPDTGCCRRRPYSTGGTHRVNPADRRFEPPTVSPGMPHLRAAGLV